ncbi:SGNH/GDSL hydrolase family protein [Bacillus sp. JJ722]|uniref:SGNH/GDSL hydrolase family protein n=1 Tax=Bacillus sp. JJ722 TaxID=3122973 RepID=UPI002FFF2675
MSGYKYGNQVGGGQVKTVNGSLPDKLGDVQVTPVLENNSIIPEKTTFAKELPDPNFIPTNYLSGITWSEKGNVMSTNGSPNALADWTHSTFIPVEPNKKYILSCKYGSWNYILFDSTKKIGAQTSFGLVYNNTTKEIQTPSTTAFIVFNAKMTTGEGFNQPEKMVDPNETATYITIPKLRVKAEESFFKNKKIVMFGDSNIGNFQGDGIPSLLSTILGVTAYNAGFGATRMSTHPNAEYDAFCIHSLADSIETGNWALQDTKIVEHPELPSTFKQSLNTLKSINWQYVDYVAICHGSNDWTNYNTKIENPDNLKDFNMFKGGFRYFYDKLLKKNPKIKVLLMTSPFRGVVAPFTETSDTLQIDKPLNKTLPEYIDATHELGREFKIPVLDLYYEGGINATNWTQYLPDGAHFSLESREIVARRVSAKIQSSF